MQYIILFLYSFSDAQAPWTIITIRNISKDNIDLDGQYVIITIIKYVSTFIKYVST